MMLTKSRARRFGKDEAPRADARGIFHPPSPPKADKIQAFSNSRELVKARLKDGYNYVIDYVIRTYGFEPQVRGKTEDLF